MARSPARSLGAIASLALLAGCPRGKPATDVGPLDPLYDPVRVGEVYVVRMDHGTPLTTRAEIKAVTSETVTVVTRTSVAGTTIEPQTKELRRRQGPLDRKLAAASTARLVGRETLEVSGIAFDCAITEITDPWEGLVRSWRCETHYPGLVKQVDASGKTLYLLTAVEAPRP